MMTVVTTQPFQKERVRGPYLRALVPRSKCVSFERALVLAEGAVIASNKKLDKALVGSDEWRSISQVFAAWSGTMTAYVEPGQKLGKQVEYSDPITGYRWVFAVPEAHRDKKNAILVAEHPDYTLEVDGNNRVVHAKSVDLVETFPANGGWYLTDLKHGIPIGEQVDSANSDSRYLWRIINKRAGPVWRGCDDFYGFNGNYRRFVDLGGGPSVGFGVAVEASGAGPENRDSLPVQ